MNSEKYRVTFILIAVNVAVYIYTSVVGGNFLVTGDNMIWQWGQVNGLVLYYGAYYQLFTSMFVHAGISHLVGNMLFLFIFGLRAEEMFSLPEYIIIFLLGGLAGNLLSLALLPLGVPSVGASGAIFAVFGACVIYARRSVRQSILGALVYAFFLLLISSGLGVNNFAHLGGLAVGLVIGYLAGTKRKPTDAHTYKYAYTTPF